MDSVFGEDSPVSNIFPHGGTGMSNYTHAIHIGPARCALPSANPLLDRFFQEELHIGVKAFERRELLDSALDR